MSDLDRVTTPSLASGDWNALEIFSVFQNQYQNRIAEIDIKSSSEYNEKLNVVYHDWINDLTKQNLMLIEIVTEIEQETEKRMILFDKKVAEIYQSNRNSIIEMNFIYNFIGSLKNDLFNLIEFLNRLATSDKNVQFADLVFKFVDLNRILEKNKIIQKLSNSGIDGNTYFNEIQEKNKMIRDQEDRILHLKQLILNKDLKSELLERNQKLLNQIKYKDELIDAMRAEVESFQNHDCFSNYVDNFKIQLEEFTQKYTSLKKILLKKSNDEDVTDLIKRKEEIIKLQSETIEISQKNVSELIEKIDKLKLQKDHNETKLVQFRNLLVNYQGLVVDLETMLQDNKNKVINFEKTVHLHKDTIDILENANILNKNQIEKKNFEIHDLSNKVNELQTNYFTMAEEKNSTISSMNNENHHLKSEINHLNQEISSRDSIIKNCKEKLINTEECLRQKANELNQFFETKSQLEQIVEQFNEKFANLSPTDESTLSLNAQYKLLIEKLQVVLVKLQNDCRIQDIEHEQLIDKLNILCMERNDLSETVTLLKNELNNRNSSLSNLEQENRLHSDIVYDLKLENQYLRMAQEEERKNFNKVVYEMQERINRSENTLRNLSIDFENLQKKLNKSLEKEISLREELDNCDKQQAKLSKKNQNLELKMSTIKEEMETNLREKDDKIRELQKHFNQVKLENSKLLNEKNDFRNIFEQIIEKKVHPNRLKSNDMDDDNMDTFDITETFTEYWFQKIKSISKELIKSNTFWRNQWNQRKSPEFDLNVLE